MGISPQAFLLSSLMLTRLQKSPTSFDSFEKDSSPWLRSRWNNVRRNLTVGTYWLKKQLIASNLLPSSEIWVSVAHKIIVPLILPWSSFRPYQPGILGISPPKRLSTSTHTSRTHISRVSRMARPPTRKLGRRKRDNIAWNTSGLKTTLVLPQSPMSMPPTLPVRLARTWVISLVSTVTRRVTIQQSVPSQRRTETFQNISDSLDNIHFDDWGSLLLWNEFFAFDTRFESKKIEKKMNGGLDSYDSHDGHNVLDGHDAAMY